MKLNKFHAFYTTFCPVNHRNTIARSDDRIRSSAINLSDTACTNHSCSSQNSFYFIRFFVQSIRTITLNIWCNACNIISQMVLRNNIYCEKMFVYVNVWKTRRLFYQSTLHFPTRQIFIMQNTIFGVTAFFGEVIFFLVFFFVKTCAPIYQFLHTFGPFFHYNFDHF